MGNIFSMMKFNYYSTMNLHPIEQDQKDMDLLLESAKFGRWEIVWGILEKKPFLINCCPENRRWTVLQQAVWWNNTEIITKLLKMPTIDTYGTAKQGKSEIGDDGGLTAFEIAEKFKYDAIAQLCLWNRVPRG